MGKLKPFLDPNRLVPTSTIVMEKSCQLNELDSATTLVLLYVLLRFFAFSLYFTRLYTPRREVLSLRRRTLHHACPSGLSVCSVSISVRPSPHPDFEKIYEKDEESRMRDTFDRYLFASISISSKVTVFQKRLP